jgi:hypothetical protein
MKKRKTSPVKCREISRSVLGVRQSAIARRAARSRNYVPVAKKRGTSRALKQLLIPRAENNYRPHLVRRWGLLAVLLISLAVNGAYFFVKNREILGDQDGITVAKLLIDTNKARIDEHLSQLNINAELTLAATNKANDMLAKDYWSHNAPDGATPWQFVDAAGYSYSLAGENLARGFANADTVVAAWLASPSHRANVLDPSYTDVGFAVVSGKMNGQTTTLVVAMYGCPIEASGMLGASSRSGEVDGATRVGVIETSDSLWTHLQRGMHDLTPSLIFTLVLLGLVTCVALLAHAYRLYLPVGMLQTWYRHHALVKICLVAVLAAGAILSYGGGLI